MTVKEVLWVQGPYDIVVISEASDETKANAFALSTLKMGNVRGQTLRAFTAAEMEKSWSMSPKKAFKNCWQGPLGSAQHRAVPRQKKRCTAATALTQGARLATHRRGPWRGTCDGREFIGAVGLSAAWPQERNCPKGKRSIPPGNDPFPTPRAIPQFRVSNP
jgi:hypothetical protein